MILIAIVSIYAYCLTAVIVWHKIFREPKTDPLAERVEKLESAVNRLQFKK